MATRDPERERQWRLWLTEWQQSNLSVYAFCKVRNLQKTTFYYWQKKLGFLRTAAPTPAAFVPVTLITEPLVEIASGGVVLKVPLGASREQIATWLSAVKSC